MTTSLLLSKITGISSAGKRPTVPPGASSSNGQHEKRSEFRCGSNERLFFQVVHSEDKDLIGTTLSSNVLNSSANDLKAVSEKNIPAGCVVDLWVDDSARPGKFFLSSEVRWVLEDESGAFSFGVELLDGAATDIAEWREPGLARQFWSFRCILNHIAMPGNHIP